jgi:hypothetical protein
MSCLTEGVPSKKKTQKQLIKEKDEQDRLQREAEAVCYLSNFIG